MARSGFKRNLSDSSKVDFQGRDAEITTFINLLKLPNPPVVNFYGIGGVGKTWLLRKFQAIAIQEKCSTAYINLDRTQRGNIYLEDSFYTLFILREQIGGTCPRFDIAYSVLRYKQGETKRPELLNGSNLADTFKVIQFIFEGLISYFSSGVMKDFSSLEVWILKNVLDKYKNSIIVKDIYSWILSQVGFSDFYELINSDIESIEKSLVSRIAEDWRSINQLSIKEHAPKISIFIDSVDWINNNSNTKIQTEISDKWLRDLCIEAESVLFILCSQNELTWEKYDVEWSNHLKRYELQGFLYDESVNYLHSRGVSDSKIKKILDIARYGNNRYHPLILASIADAGLLNQSENLHLGDNKWNYIVNNFLKSLNSDSEINVIKSLAITPRFDFFAIEEICKKERTSKSFEQDIAVFSFIEVIPSSFKDSWWRIRTPIREAILETIADQDLQCQRKSWFTYWLKRIETITEEQSAMDLCGLTWSIYRDIDPQKALAGWHWLSFTFRELGFIDAHANILNWWNNTSLEDKKVYSLNEVNDISIYGHELILSREINNELYVKRILLLFESAIESLDEDKYPEQVADLYCKLGYIYLKFPVNIPDNVKKAIHYLEASSRLINVSETPEKLASVYNLLGISYLDIKEKNENVIKISISNFEKSLSIFVKDKHPYQWAGLQNNLGTAYRKLCDFSFSKEYLKASIKCYKNSMDVWSKSKHKTEWAGLQKKIGMVYGGKYQFNDSRRNIEISIRYFLRSLEVLNENRSSVEYGEVMLLMGNSLRMRKKVRLIDIHQSLACFKKSLVCFDENMLFRGIICFCIAENYFTLFSGYLHKKEKKSKFMKKSMSYMSIAMSSLKLVLPVEEYEKLSFFQKKISFNVNS